MATTLYFHNTSNPAAGTYPSGEQGGATATFTATGANTLKTMYPTIGTAQQSMTGTTSATTNSQNGFLGFFVSPPLSGAQTVGGGSITLATASLEGSTFANFNINSLNIYVWRPSTGTKVGTVRDASGSSLGGAETGTTETTNYITGITSSAVSAADGDVIICEIWSTFAQGMASGYTVTFYYDGTTAISSDGAAISSAASSITLNENLKFKYYWTGGTGTWDASTATKWAASSGGTGGAGVPTTVDDVIIDNGSGTGTITGNGGVCDNLTITTPSGALTLAPTTSGLSIYGSASIPTSNLTISGAAAITFAAIDSQTITSNGTTWDCPITFNGVGGTWTLQDNMTVGATRTTTLNNGTLDLNGKNLSTGTFSSTNTNTRSLTSATAATIFITYTTAVSATVWDTGTVTGLTGSNNITVDITGNNAVTKTINSGALSESNSFNFNVGGNGSTIAFTASNTVKDLTITNTTCTVSNIAITIYGNLTVSGTSPTFTPGTNIWTFAATSGTKTITSNGKTLDFPITFDGSGGTWRLVDNLTIGATRTTTLTLGTLDLNGKNLSTGIFSSSNSNIRGLTSSTTVTVFITSTSTGTVWNTGTATNLTGSNNITVDITGNDAATKTISTGSLSQANAFVFNIGGNGTTLSLSGRVKDLTITNTTCTVTNAATNYGNLLIAGSSPTIPISQSGPSFAATSGIKTITTNGVAIPTPISFNGVGGSWELVGDLIGYETFPLTLNNGTFNANNYNVSVGKFNSNNTNTRTLIMGFGLWTLTGNDTFVWDLGTATGLTFNANTANIFLSNNSSSLTRTFTTAGLTYNKLTIGGATGTSTTTFTGSGTFSELASTKTVAHTIKFTAGTTTTVGAWTITGSVGAIVTLTSETAASHTLVKSGGGTVNVDYFDISYSTATPDSTWYANNSTDSGNNLGWIFSGAPVSTTAGQMIMIFLP